MMRTWEMMRYHTHGGQIHEAVWMTWDQVRAVLGRDHRGDPDDDAILTRHILDNGGPAWVGDSQHEGWINEHGWGVIGPELPDAC